MGLDVVARAGLLPCLPSSSFDFVDGRDRTEECPKYSEGNSCIEESNMGERCGVADVNGRS